MSRPFLLAQLSDPHIGAEWAGGDPVAGLAAAVEAVAALRPDAVLVSGDLADHAADREYELVRELLAPLRMPLHVLPGNHDDRRLLHRHFGVPGGSGEPVRYSVELGPLRLVVLDTTRPGEDPGALDTARLGWLDAELEKGPHLPTLLAMHHPPLATGVPAWDDFGLPAADRLALRDVVERHPQVRLLVAAHVHRVITGELAGRPVLTAPSTYVQAEPNFDSGAIEWAHEPVGFALHVVLDGELTSHIQLVAPDSQRPAA
ncbi:MAG: metallophosphoesterase [Gaiellaceae bacterium]